FAKNAELTPVLAQGDWWHIVPSAVLTCLLPDIDHPKSFLGQRLKWIAKPIARAFGHRGFTHSLLAVFALLTLFYLKVPDSWIVPADAIQGMVLGYLSHILADMLTPAGVPLLWPCRWRFRFPLLAPQKGNQLERVLCMALFAYAVWMPQTLPENGAVRWSSQMINTLQFQFNRFIHHQIEQ
ncbi:metal-dependent hydrolase, partial [Huaxiibacter chinensis]